MSGMVGQITKTGGTNAITGGTYNWWDKCPTSYTVKICPASSSVAVFKLKLASFVFFISLIIVHCDQYRSLDRAIVTGCRHVCLSSVCL